MRKNESGTVASFVIGAVVLVFVVLGAIYFARYRGSVGESTPPAIEVSQPDSDTPEAAKPDDEKKDSAEDDKAAQQKQETDKKAAEEAKKQEQAEKEPASEIAQSGQTEESTPSERREVAANTTLPETGAADILTTVIGALAIAGAGYVYYHFGRK